MSIHLMRAQPFDSIIEFLSIVPVTKVPRDTKVIFREAGMNLVVIDFLSNCNSCTLTSSNEMLNGVSD